MRLPWLGGRRGAGAVALLVAALLTGCAAPRLMPTPNAYRDPGFNPFDAVPAALQSSRVEVLYVTDRHKERDRDGRPAYGHRRSAELAFGACVVEIGEGLDWETLVAQSRTGQRRQALPVRVAWVEERGRFPAPPAAAPTAVGLEFDPQEVARTLRATTRFQEEVRRRLALTPRKDVFVFVHGFNNTFDWAALIGAQMWHYLPRQGVPLVYTWPAGRGGLRGYTYDRESGEFTVVHLKQTLRALIDCPELERIHLIAHSRGTDVATTAVRELLIEHRGGDPRAVRLPKLENLILIAPDLDFEVAGQRLGAERVSTAAGRTTVYVCERDRAVNLANWLFEGFRRMGQLRTRDFSEEQKRQLRRNTGIQFIDARVKTDLLGHGYFHSSPAVSSDLLQLLRENCDAGDESCRPLPREDGFFWRIRDDYLAPPPE